jgi:hypothetical protein
MSQNSPKRWFGLEEKFFSSVDNDLIEKLRGQMSLEHTAEEIMQVAGISDEKLAAEIAKMNVTPETLAAFRLVPLVAVAWADDRVEASERYAITQAAAKSGIAADDPAMKLLEGWTERRPTGELLDTWCDYSKALCASLSEEHRELLKVEVMRSAQSVAEAAGGILGFGSVSPGEKAVMARIESALS